MFNKQINGVKFRELKDGTIEITYSRIPKYKDCQFNPHVVSHDRGMDEYKILFAQKYADKVFDTVLKELGLNLQTAHLLTDRDTITKDGRILTHFYAGTRQTVTTPKVVFTAYMEKALKKKGVDLSYIATDTAKYHLHIAGNAGSIAWIYRDFLFRDAWVPCELSTQDLKLFIEKHKNIRIFEETNADKREISREKLLETKFGSASSHRGYGSQSSIAISTVKLKRDAKGNLLITRNTEIWD